MTSVLESEYIEPTRPYSQDELKQFRQNLYRKLRLGKTQARHQRCGHFYLVKQNGRKEKEMHERKSVDVGNCSVCWKIGKTQGNKLREKARDLVEIYSNTFFEQDDDNKPYLTYSNMDVEDGYYRWLYDGNV